jgi:hypothetical protein
VNTPCQSDGEQATVRVVQLASPGTWMTAQPGSLSSCLGPDKKKKPPVLTKDKGLHSGIAFNSASGCVLHHVSTIEVHKSGWSSLTIAGKRP